jgi:hypothetical protein
MPPHLDLIGIRHQLAGSEDRYLDFQGTQFRRLYRLKSRVLHGGTNGAVLDRLVKVSIANQLTDTAPQLLPLMKRDKGAES